MDNVNLKIFKGLIIISLILTSGVAIDFQFDKKTTNLYRNGDLIAVSDFIVNAERTYFNLDSYYDEKVKCPKVEAMGGHRTATRCYYPDNYYERIKRDLLRTDISANEFTNKYTTTKTTPYYAYGTRGAKAGILYEGMEFDKQTQSEEDFPNSYDVMWTPKDTRNYQITWRLQKLDTSNYADGSYYACDYVFGNVKIDLLDNCQDLNKVELSGNTALFYFVNSRGIQDFNLGFVDPIPDANNVSSAKIGVIAFLIGQTESYINDSLDYISQNGNIIEIPIYMSAYEPSNNSWSASVNDSIEYILNYADDKEINIILNLNTNSEPDWIRAIPDANQTTSTGAVVSGSSGATVAYNNPDVLTEKVEFLEKVVSTFKHHRSVYAWMLDNEFKYISSTVDHSYYAQGDSAIVVDDFESGDISQWSGQSIILNTTTVKKDTYSLQINYTGSSWCTISKTTNQDITNAENIIAFWIWSPINSPNTWNIKMGLKNSSLTWKEYNIGGSVLANKWNRVIVDISSFQGKENVSGFRIQLDPLFSVSNRTLFIDDIKFIKNSSYLTNSSFRDYVFQKYSSIANINSNWQPLNGTTGIIENYTYWTDIRMPKGDTVSSGTPWYNQSKVAYMDFWDWKSGYYIEYYLNQTIKAISDNRNSTQKIGFEIDRNVMWDNYRDYRSDPFEIARMLKAAGADVLACTMFDGDLFEPMSFMRSAADYHNLELWITEFDQSAVAPGTRSYNKIKNKAYSILAFVPDVMLYYHYGFIVDYENSSSAYEDIITETEDMRRLNYSMPSTTNGFSWNRGYFLDTNWWNDPLQKSSYGFFRAIMREHKFPITIVDSSQTINDSINTIFSPNTGSGYNYISEVDNMVIWVNQSGKILITDGWLGYRTETTNNYASGIMGTKAGASTFNNITINNTNNLIGLSNGTILQSCNFYGYNRGNSGISNEYANYITKSSDVSNISFEHGTTTLRIGNRTTSEGGQILIMGNIGSEYLCYYDNKDYTNGEDYLSLLTESFSDRPEFSIDNPNVSFNVIASATNKMFFAIEMTDSSQEVNIWFNKTDERVYGLSNKILSYQDSINYTMDSSTSDIFLLTNISSFNLSQNDLTAKLYDANNNIIDNRVPVQIISVSNSSIKFNSSQNYTETNWQIIIEGDLSERGWKYKSYYNDWISIDSTNIIFNGTNTFFNLDNINVSKCFDSNELTNTPYIQFELPTAQNNTYTAKNHTYVNITTTDNLDTTAFIDFNNSLVGWWRFNDNTTEDHSTYQNNGTNHSSTYTEDGKFGGAREFDGVNDYVDCGNDASLNFTGTDEFTFESWIYPISGAEYPTIIGKRDASGYQYHFRLKEGILSFLTTSGAQDSTLSVANNQWSHVVVVRKTTGTYFYVNGIENIRGAVTPSYKDIPVTIGGLSNDYYFNGTIDEVKIHNRTLTANEINASYNAGLYRLYNNFTDLAEGQYTYTAYSQDLAGNVNQTETRTIVINDTCVCPGVAATWIPNMASCCNISTSCNLTTGSLYLNYNTGANNYFRINTTSFNASDLIMGTDSILYMTDIARLYLNGL